MSLFNYRTIDENIFIPGNVPSSKNNKQIFMAGKFPTLQWSPLAKRYRKDIAQYLDSSELRGDFWKQCEEFGWPIGVGFHFIRNSKREFDFHNAVQTISDLLVNHEWIPDDSMKVFIPLPLYLDGCGWHSLDYENPGVIIKPVQLTELTDKLST